MNISKGVSRALKTRDMMTFDQATIDSAGAFLVGELERLDQTLHTPLVDFKWSRDIDLRSDVSLADEFSSFTNSQFASSNGIAGSNKAWVGKDSSAMVNVQLDIGKTIQPLQLWAVQIGWTIPELASAQALGRPIDSQKLVGLQLKHNMDIDEQVYTGDTVLGMNGIFNHSALTNVGNAITGGWATATPAQILADVNEILRSVWAASGYAAMPNRLLISPTEYGILVSTMVNSAANKSVLAFLMENNLATQNGEDFKILPSKWCLGTNNGNTRAPTATNFMFAYQKRQDRVRFPLVQLQRTPVEYRDLRQIVTYYGRLGAVEMVYPETHARRANLG